MHKYWAKKEPWRAGLFDSNMFKVGRVVCGGIKEFSSFSVNIRFLPGRLLESRPNGANLQYKNERIQVKRATQFNTRNCLRQCENGHWTMDDGRHHCEGGGPYCVGGQKQRENKK